MFIVIALFGLGEANCPRYFERLQRVWYQAKATKLCGFPKIYLGTNW